MEKNRYDLYFEIFNLFIIQNKYRKTQERFTILRTMVEHKYPFQVEELFVKMHNSKYHVSKATLYNNIHLMEQCGILHQCLLNGKIYYELIDVQRNEVFLIDQRGKQKIKIDSEIMERLIASVEKQEGVEILRANLYFQISNK
ncbi:MAG: transcriptional repressor [Bacteroidales bacterium]